MTPEHAPASRHDGDVTEVLLCPQGVHVTQGVVSMPGQTETHHIHIHVFLQEAKGKKTKKHTHTFTWYAVFYINTNKTNIHTYEWIIYHTILLLQIN